MNSTNPFDSPVINPNFLSDEFDIFTMRESIKAARTFMAAPAWKGWILGEVGAFAQAQTDNEIEQYVRNSCSTVNHVSGTVGMGKTGTTGKGTGALNSDLTVKGTVGLRVVDASIFVSVLFYFFLLTLNLYLIHSLAFHSSSPYPNANIYCWRACCRPDQTNMDGGLRLLKLIRHYTRSTDN